MHKRVVRPRTRPKLRYLQHVKANHGPPHVALHRNGGRPISKDIFKAFGIPDLPKLVTESLGGNAAVLPATLHSVTKGTRTNITGGTQPTETDFTCRGWIDFQNVEFSSPTAVRNGRKVVVLLGSTINRGNTAPKPGDRITIEGIKYHIPNDGDVDRDPASVSYTCEVREV